MVRSHLRAISTNSDPLRRRGSESSEPARALQATGPDRYRRARSIGLRANAFAAVAHLCWRGAAMRVAASSAATETRTKAPNATG